MALSHGRVLLRFPSQSAEDASTAATLGRLSNIIVVAIGVAIVQQFAGLVLLKLYQHYDFDCNYYCDYNCYYYYYYYYDYCYYYYYYY